MSRLTRKEIKRDEFAKAVGRSVEYAESHSRGLIFGIGAALLALVAGVAIFLFLSHRADRANEALAFAVKVYQAPIDPAGAKPNDAKEPSFANEVQRRARARQLLAAVRSDYHFSDAADVAAIYLAELEAAEGKTDQARRLWSELVSKHGRQMVGAQARVNLMDLDRKQGKGQKVVQDLKTMLDESDPPLPQDVILYQLATTLEQLGRRPEAAQSYQRIVDEFPQSAYRQPAQQRLSELEPARAAGAASFGSLPSF
ncbi:MAG TPA: tetratricopeptide repeat protein [Thermoanaerobaculia bacterium]|nr:tetratricopeptide repeat protein [Thermoanaerobaculia bacterium]